MYYDNNILYFMSIPATRISHFCLLMLPVLFLSCRSTSPLQHPTTNSTLWMQHAAEYEALTTMIYRSASANLSLSIEDTYWDAITNRKDSSYRELPPAIIVDVDETILDNSAFQARMINQNSEFLIEQWNEWVMEAGADAIPGALDFLKEADRRDITIFYITNREAKVEEGTLKNLRKLGFPLDTEKDLVLSNNERENWTSAKIVRRANVAKYYRVIMIFGDDLNDFVSAKNITLEQRKTLVEKYKRKWGRQWFVLPNPVYGSWESALYDFDHSLSEDEIKAVKRSRLDTKE